MEKIKEILEYVKKTNPEMTEEKLLKELKKSRYSFSALALTVYMFS